MRPGTLDAVAGLAEAGVKGMIDPGPYAGECDLSQSRRAVSMRVCHPSPVARKAPTTSGDRRMLIIPVEHIDLNFILVPRSDMRQMVTAK